MKPRITDELSANYASKSMCRNGRGVILTITIVLLSCLWASATGWNKVSTPAALVTLSAGSTQVWALGSGGTIFQYNGTKFVQISGQLSQIAVGELTNVWGLTSSGKIYQYNFKLKQFQQVHGSLAYIAAGGNGVWGLSSAGKVYEYSPGTKSFQQVTCAPSNPRTIYVGSFEIGVWILDSSGGAWLYNTNTGCFDATDGVLAMIAEGDGQVWGITSTQTVWQYDVSSEKWFQPSPHARLSWMSAGSDSNIWGIDSSGKSWKFNQGMQIFMEESTTPDLIWISVTSGKAGIWALDKSGNPYKW